MKRIFYATDVHGSEKAYKKFLSAAKFYNVDTLILGGDLTGKFLVPIVETPDGNFDFRFLGQDFTLKSTKEVEAYEKLIRDSGQYVYRTNLNEFKELKQNHSKLDEIFKVSIQETLQMWVKLAEERLKGTGTKIFITGGNDDPLEIENILMDSDYIIDPEEEVIKIYKNLEMASLGYSNMTPWNCPRDIPEEELSNKLGKLLDKVENMDHCIFNFHCPPKDSTLDTCVKLDTSVTPPKPVVDESGDLVFFGAGSSSVSAAIKKHQPLLGLHGHIHEARGSIKIGRTICINPGSEYGEGLLRGALINIDIDKGKIKSYQLTCG